MILCNAIHCVCTPCIYARQCWSVWHAVPWDPEVSSDSFLTQPPVSHWELTQVQPIWCPNAKLNLPHPVPLWLIFIWQIKGLYIYPSLNLLILDLADQVHFHHLYNTVLNRISTTPSKNFLLHPIFLLVLLPNGYWKLSILLSEVFIEWTFMFSL